MENMFFAGVVTASLALTAPVAMTADVATVSAEGLLRAEPSPAAASVASLLKGSKVEVLERKGFWVKVRAGTDSGWVKMNSVSFIAAPNTPSGIAGASTGRTGKGNVVSATGTRGLSSESLVSARPDFGALQQLQRSAVPSEEASRFASAGGLVTRKVEYIRSPNGGSGPTSNREGGA